MRILVSGATGLIGKEVGKRLVQNGHSIIALVRDVESARKNLPFPATLVSWKVGDEISSELASDVDAVLNLAGDPISGRWTDEKKKKVMSSRVEGTRTLVQFAVKHGIKTFVSGSATGYYGNRGDDVLDESASAGTGFLADVAKAWEDELAPLEGRARWVAVRTSVVLARHGGALEKMLPLFEKGLGGRLGSGKQWMSWIHLDDIARLFVFALETPRVQGAINGASPEPVRNERFTAELSRALHKPAFLPAPEFALKLALGEMSTMVLDSQRAVPTATLAFGFKFEHPEIEEALDSVVGPFREGQRELLSEQWLPLKPAELFPFYCDEKNLEALTPPFLKFRVLGKSTPEMGDGTLIDYRLSLHGLPFKWRTEIKDWQPNKRFVDEQLRGPYQRWHHVHDFIELGGGTLIRDRVTYKLPLGFLGDTVAGWKVTGDVEKIFAYRREVIDARFGAGGVAGSGGRAGAGGRA